MNELELKRILNEFRFRQYENEVVEFKEAKQSFDLSKLGMYFSALSNEANLKRQEKIIKSNFQENLKRLMVGMI